MAGYYGFTSVIRVSVRLYVFSIPVNNLMECQWIFTRFNVSIDIVQIWFGISNGKNFAILRTEFLCI